jgi:hypothetical protein
VAEESQDWPTMLKSLQLNPVEYMWSIAADIVAEIASNTLADLKKEIMKAYSMA